MKIKNYTLLALCLAISTSMIANPAKAQRADGLATCYVAVKQDPLRRVGDRYLSSSTFTLRKSLDYYYTALRANVNDRPDNQRGLSPEDACGMPNLPWGDPAIFHQSILFVTPALIEDSEGLRERDELYVDMGMLEDSSNHLLIRAPLQFSNPDYNIVIGNHSLYNITRPVNFRDKRGNLVTDYHRVHANLGENYVDFYNSYYQEGDGVRYERVVGHGIPGLAARARLWNTGKVRMVIDINADIIARERNTDGGYAPLKCMGSVPQQSYDRGITPAVPTKPVVFRNVVIEGPGLTKEDLFHHYDANGRYVKPNLATSYCLHDGGGVEVINTTPDEDPQPIGGGNDVGNIPPPDNTPIPNDPGGSVSGCPGGVPRVTLYFDSDGDGFRNNASVDDPAYRRLECPGGCTGDDCDNSDDGYSNYTLNNKVDCDDNNPLVGDYKTWVLDNDQDGFSSMIVASKRQCTKPADGNWRGLDDNSDPADGNQNPVFEGDCDDNDPAINPFMGGCGDDHQQNEEARMDKDQDGYCGMGVQTCIEPEKSPGDCNDDPDTGASINPNARAVADFCSNALSNPELDANCDGRPDIQDELCVGQDNLDSDGDGYCATGEQCCPDGAETCEGILGGGDCNDNNAVVNPGTIEQGTYCANNLDDDCDGAIDGAEVECQGGSGGSDGGSDPADLDIDRDGFTSANGDCDDNDPYRHPGLIEICGNNVDENCDGAKNEGCAGEPDFDDDGDGYCEGVIVPGTFELQCGLQLAPDGGNIKPGDCNDGNAQINPLAVEIPCDRIDNNCDGRVDEGSVFIDDINNGNGQNPLSSLTYHLLAAENPNIVTCPSTKIGKNPTPPCNGDNCLPPNGGGASSGGTAGGCSLVPQISFGFSQIMFGFGFFLMGFLMIHTRRKQQK